METLMNLETALVIQTPLKFKFINILKGCSLDFAHHENCLLTCQFLTNNYCSPDNYSQNKDFSLTICCNTNSLKSCTFHLLCVMVI